jgi:predicted glycosyltransferase
VSFYDVLDEQLLAMRYWFDLVTPKQLLFFRPVIGGLREDGHEVLTTSRRYREVDQLASMLGLEPIFAGTRGGKDPLEQFRLSLERMEELLPVVVSFSPDVSVSVASADCARISFGMRVRHVAVNDSPHSMVAGKLSLPLSHHVISPWIIPYSAWSAFGISRSQVSRYRALDPAAWLKGRPRRESPRGGHPGKGAKRATILVRLEESYAPYLAGSDESWSERILTRLAHDFKGHELVALCRYEDQLSSVRKKFGSSYVVPEEVVDGAGMIERSDVFVGMGGTMTTEAALLGVPAVSAFQGAELYTEKYLLSKRLLLKARSVGEVSKCVSASLDPRYRERYLGRARALLDWMDDPAAMVAGYLKALPPPAAK